MHAQIQMCSLPPGELYTKRCLKADSGAYAAYLRGSRCKTENDFFREISAVFQFPDYFGENWAATDECLCDLEWLSPREICLVVEDFSRMFSDQQEIQTLLQNRVIKYFTIMIEYWEGENVPVEIWLNN